MPLLLIPVGLIALAVLAGIWCYNSFVGKRNLVEQAFSNIDVLLKNRYDLIPNLVAAVTQYMRHEASTFTRITELRGKVADTGADSDTRVRAANELDHLLANIMIQVENYPDLKASANFLDLQASIAGMEGQIAAVRRAFNAAVTGYNTAIEMFPGNVLAGLFGFKRKAVLDIAPAERRSPDVNALFKR